MKKIALIAFVLSLALLLTACGGPATFADADVAKLVTLGEYKGLPYSGTVQAVNDYQLTTALNSKLKEAGYSTVSNEKITEGTLQIGDKANIDFVGKKDGVAFQGGTAGGYSLEIGSNSFIAGFEEGMVGMKVGESRSLNLTFPKNYDNAELAGQPVVFDVTLNYIESRTTYSELTDAIANELDKEVSTAAEYIANLRSELEETCKNDAETEKKSTLWSNAVQNAKVSELPKKLVKLTRQEFVDHFTDLAKQNAYDTLDEFLSANNIKKSDFDSNADTYASRIVTAQLVAYAIADKEGYAPTEEEIQKSAVTYAAQNGYADADAYIKAIGKDSAKDQVVLDYAIDLVVNNSVEK